MSHLDVLMHSSKTVYSHLTNKKKELKRFLEYINVKSSYNFRVLVKNKRINRSISSRLATCRHNTKILGTLIWIRLAARKHNKKILGPLIWINKKMIKRINLAKFIESNLMDLIKFFLLVYYCICFSDTAYSTFYIKNSKSYSYEFFCIN